MEYLKLVKPAVGHRDEYIAMVNEFIEKGEGYAYNNVDLASEDFAAFVQELENEARGIGLPAGIPAQQTYLLLKDERMVVGEIRFRPAIVPPFEKYFGHIAYNVRPSQRNQGYATRMLALVLEEARKLHLPFVTLTVEGENPASVRVIEKKGGMRLRTIANPPGLRVVEQDGVWSTVDIVRTGEELDLYVIELIPSALEGLQESSRDAPISLQS